MPASSPRGSQRIDALRESEARLRAIVETAVQAIVIIDERGRIESVNPATQRLFGWTAAELIGRNVHVLMPEPDHSQHDGYLERYLRTGERRVIGIGREVRALRKDGTTFPADLSIGEFFIRGQRHFTGILRDISDRHRLQREVLKATESERRRLGLDLHDDLCQQLAGIEYLIQSLARQLAGERMPESTQAAEIARLMRLATEHTRRLSHGLAPMGLEEGGLTLALEELAYHTSLRSGVPVNFQCHQPALIHDPELAIHLFRIAQEAVSNALKHAAPTRIEIHLGMQAARVHLAIHDDGRGLPKRPPRRRGVGLHLMQYRAAMIAGSLVLQQRVGGGTTVACTVHVPPAAPPQKIPSRHEKSPSRPARKKAATRRSTPPDPPRR
jgi:two-component system, LuxR family, sensor kinase FixL